jgi:hypothetical protein
VNTTALEPLEDAWMAGFPYIWPIDLRVVSTSPVTAFTGLEDYLRFVRDPPAIGHLQIELATSHKGPVSGRAICGDSKRQSDWTHAQK